MGWKDLDIYNVGKGGFVLMGPLSAWLLSCVCYHAERLVDQLSYFECSPMATTIIIIDAASPLITITITIHHASTSLLSTQLLQKSTLKG